MGCSFLRRGIFLFLYPFLSSCSDWKKSAPPTSEGLPPLDLRRDELPYLRMGKAFGSLSVRKDDFSSVGAEVPAEKSTFFDRRWKRIVSFVQKSYPLSILKPGFLVTDFSKVSQIAGLLSKVEVSLRPEPSSPCEVKVFFLVNPDFEVRTDERVLKKEEIRSSIIMFDRDFFEKSGKALPGQGG